MTHVKYARYTIAALAALSIVGLGLTSEPSPPANSTLLPLHVGAVVGAAVTPPSTLRVLAVGDSITCGDNCAGPGGSYRPELGALAASAGTTITWSVAAVGGVACDYWVNSIAALVAAFQPDAILLNCGTNNDGRSNIAGFENTYRTLINNMLGASTTVRVFPSWVQYSAAPIAPAWLRESQPAINDAIYRVVLSHPQWRNRIPNIVDQQQIPEGYLDSGGVHPTSVGYRVMAANIFDRMRATYGWTDVAPHWCGQTGHRWSYGIPAYRPIETGCPA